MLNLSRYILVLTLIIFTATYISIEDKLSKKEHLIIIATFIPIDIYGYFNIINNIEFLCSPFNSFLKLAAIGLTMTTITSITYVILYLIIHSFCDIVMNKNMITKRIKSKIIRPHNIAFLLVLGYSEIGLLGCLFNLSKLLN